MRKIILAAIAVLSLSGLFFSHAFAQPTGLDFGDAPEGAIAYPPAGVVGAFPTCITVGPALWVQHTNFGAWFGGLVDFEPDGNGGLCPSFSPYNNDECFADGDAGLIIPPAYTIVLPFPLSVAPCVPGVVGALGLTCTTAAWGPNVDILVRNFMPSGTIGLVNVLMDWDQNGMWAGASSCPPTGTPAPEHVLVNFPVPNGFIGPLSALGPPPFLIGPNPGYVWTRFTISEIPVPVGWDGSGGFEDGESEDYLLRIDPQQQPTMLPVITECPVVDTECPVADTRCPVVQTSCPKVQTECPIVDTQCPVIDTRCPSISTHCPESFTLCPTYQTWCPVNPTICPVDIPTVCPEIFTQCPRIDTGCPQVPTQCQITNCPLEPTQCFVDPTFCPWEFTICPQERTMCPEIHTVCPDSTPTICKLTLCPQEQTLCPENQTQCPIAPTICPAGPITVCGPITSCPLDGNTICPDMPTQCPTRWTFCPEVPTQCPVVETICPNDPTFCASPPTSCPTGDPTWCPEVPTQCPQLNTWCPDNVPTLCEITNCPVSATLCPINPTVCPQNFPTICPAVATQCPQVVTQCPVNPTYCPAVDSDGDGVLDCGDNCPNHDNGPLAGTCTSGTIGKPCLTNLDCGAGGFCSKNQEDNYPPPGNNCGNACECEGNFDGDADQDGSDAATFKADFGRSAFKNPCTNAKPCNGDFDCDVDVDGSDAAKFKEDFGRSPFKNPCPNCVTVPYCVYP